MVGVVSSKISRSSKYWYSQGLGIFTSIVGVCRWEASRSSKLWHCHWLGIFTVEVVSIGIVTGLLFSLY